MGDDGLLGLGGGVVGLNLLTITLPYLLIAAFTVLVVAFLREWERTFSAMLAPRLRLLLFFLLAVTFMSYIVDPSLLPLYGLLMGVTWMGDYAMRAPERFRQGSVKDEDKEFTTSKKKE